MTYLECKEASKKLLDLLDIEHYMEPEIEISDLMQKIENAYEDNEFPYYINNIVEAYPFEGEVFNLIDEYEFMQYCKERYNKYWREDIEVHFYLCN